MKFLVSLIILCSANMTHAQFSQEQRDRIQLQKLFQSLYDIAKHELKCEADDDCVVYPAGSRACGGPSDYVLTSVNNEYLPYVEYLSKQTKEKEHEFNKKYGIMSTCELRVQPSALCEAKLCITQ